jgi:translation initiation factor 2 alpha subunit (eIF-2alpha)
MKTIREFKNTEMALVLKELDNGSFYLIVYSKESEFGQPYKTLDEANIAFDKYVPKEDVEIMNSLSVLKEEAKNNFVLVASDVKSGHFDFPPECMEEYVSILFDEIENLLLNKTLNTHKGFIPQ